MPGVAAGAVEPRPFTLWFTGLSGAGKSTLAGESKQRLAMVGHACYVLDGDVLRTRLSSDLGFTPAHRSENVRRVAEVCRLMNDADLIVIAALISPNASDRALARGIVGAGGFVEVHLDADPAVCEQRVPQ